MAEQRATTPKQAYDKAAEAFCDHVLACPDCTMRGPHCGTGNDLLRVENETWNMYRAAPDRAALADDGREGER